MRVRSTILKGLIAGAAICPALFMFVMFQYSVITFPFWDHVELIKFISAYQQGALTFFDLISPHNQTRPLTYRAIYVFNAALTGWDIRSEYIMMHATLLLTFALYAYASWKLTDERVSYKFLTALLILSIILFSPVGHNNHWWSMMLQLNLANLLIAGSLLAVALGPDRLLNHVAAVIFGWLASYTLTNGLFVFIVVIVTLQLARRSVFSLKLDMIQLVWIINAIVLALVYLPGIPTSGSVMRPGIVDIARFTLAYLGNPIASLIWYPFTNQFHIPGNTNFNAITGACILTAGMVLLRPAMSDLKLRRPPAFVFFLFAGFAVLSALATAWGRAAFDEFGVANANASRYSIFAAYLPVGIFLYQMARWKRDEGPQKWWSGHSIAIGCLIAFSSAAAVSYARSLPVYESSRVFNQMLAVAFADSGFENENNRLIYPNPVTVIEAKAKLLELGIGPYRFRHAVNVQLPGEPVPANDSIRTARTLKQRVTLDANNLQALRVALAPAPDRLNRPFSWEVYEVGSAARTKVSSGSYSLDAVTSAREIILPVKSCRSTSGCRREFEISIQSLRESGFDMLAFRNVTSEESTALLTVDDKPAPFGINLALGALYIN